MVKYILDNFTKKKRKKNHSTQRMEKSTVKAQTKTNPHKQRKNPQAK